MAKERGIVMQVVRSFLASITPRTTKKNFIGEDYNGTKYYEDPAAKRQRGRSYVPVNPDAFDQDIPAEWESWLRYRRREPPTDEEVIANYQLMMQKKINAAQLDEQYAAELSEKHKKEGKPLEAPKQHTAFPTYDDYQNYGSDYKPRSNK